MHHKVGDARLQAGLRCCLPHKDVLLIASLYKGTVRSKRGRISDSRDRSNGSKQEQMDSWLPAISKAEMAAPLTGQNPPE